MAGDSRAKELIDLGNRLFTKRAPMLSLWQEMAEHFYPERADFTDQFVIGEDFARHQEDSYPTILRRELGNNISSMLRPRDRQWFKTTTLDDDRDEDPNNAAYLEYVVTKMRRLMYDSRTQLVRATKAADNDFITFGQAVISATESPQRNHLFYKCFHLRDCVWLENAIGEVDHLHRKDYMTAREMIGYFGEKNLDRRIMQAAKREPGKEFEVRCIVMPISEYDMIRKQAERMGKPKPKYVVVYIDVGNCKIITEGVYKEFPYIVPRWHTIPGFQYAYSPASSVALPDARMMQQMARIILEAGEKAVDPPIVAVEEAVREVNIQAGAITWTDNVFDGKLKEAVQPIQIDADMTVAFAMRTDMREMMQKAWFIDKLQMPVPEGADQMTAREVSIRQQEFIRNLLPLFEPIEVEYNTKLLDKSFMLLRGMGFFPPEEVPEGLSGADIQWQFESPVQEGAQRIKTSQFQETMELIAMGAQMGLQAPPIDLQAALLDAIRGTSAPGDWFKSDEQLEKENQEAEQQKQFVQTTQQIQELAGTVGMAADASSAVSAAMQPPGMPGGAAPGGKPKAAPAPQAPQAPATGGV